MTRLAITFLMLAAARLATAQESAWDLLDKGLHDSNPEKRQRAIAAIGSIGAEPKAVERVQSALEDKDVLVRQTAAATLGVMKAKTAIPALRNALQDVPEVSFTAAKALWDLGDMTGRVIFNQVLTGERKDAPGLVEGSVRDAKRKLHNPNALALMGIKEASGILLGPAAIGINVAEDVMKDSGASGRTIAASVLAKDPSPAALELLEWALGDKNWAVRAAVAKALGERGNHETIAKLEPLLTDSKEPVRLMAAASIVRLSLLKAKKTRKRKG